MDVRRANILSCCLFILSHNQINGQIKEMKAEIVTVVEQETAILPCSKTLTGGDEVIWIGRNGTLLSVDGILTVKAGRVSVELSSSDQWNLHIQDAQYSDQGIYECRINSQPPMVKQVILVVQIPPTIRSPSTSSIEVIESTVVELECVSLGIPPPTVKWFRTVDSFNLIKKELMDGSEGFYIDKENTLMIRNMTKNKEGGYECHAFNGAGEGVKSRFQISYIKLPSYVGPTFENVAAESSGTALLPCAVKDLGAFMIVWRRWTSTLSIGNDILWSDRYTIKRSPGQWDWNLQIKPVETWHSAIYTCEVTRGSMYETVLSKTVNLTVTQ